MSTTNVEERLASLKIQGENNKDQMISQTIDIKEIKESTSKIEIGLAVINEKLDNLSSLEPRIRKLEDENVSRKASWKTITFVGGICGSILGYLSCYFTRGSK